jgi:hypothetical protein
MLNILTSDEFIDGLGHDALLESVTAEPKAFFLELSRLHARTLISETSVSFSFAHCQQGQLPPTDERF